MPNSTPYETSVLGGTRAMDEAAHQLEPDTEPHWKAWHVLLVIAALSLLGGVVAWNIFGGAK